MSNQRKNGGGMQGALLLMSNVSTSTGFAWNNIHRLFIAIANEFGRRGVPVLISFPEVSMALDEAPIGDLPGPFTLSPPPSHLRGFLRLFSVIRRQGIRYIYLTDRPYFHWQYALLRVAGIRTLVVHDRVSVPDPRPSARDGTLRTALKYIASRVTWITADRVYAVSAFVRHRATEKARFPPERVVRIMNGIDLERFSPLSSPRTDGVIEVFCGGRASRYKGIQVLIHATKILTATPGLPRFRVAYAGDGPDLEMFRRLAQQLEVGEAFKFLGEVKTTWMLQRDSDIIVVPSIWGDACPSSVAEALACGKPLVASAVGGIPEMVGDNANAVMIPPSDPKALAEALAGLLRDADSRERLGRNARRRAEEALNQDVYHGSVVQQLLSDCRLR